METTVPNAWRPVTVVPSLPRVGISPPAEQDSQMASRGLPLSRDVMTSENPAWATVGALWSAPTWRATRNVLAALLVAVAVVVLLGGIGLIWGAAIVSLVDWPVGGWAHAALYIAVVAAGPVLALPTVQGLTTLQRSRFRATLGVEIPAGARAPDRKPWPVGPWLAAATWRQLGFHLLSILTGTAGGGLVAACWLAPAAAIAYLAAGRPPAAGGAAAGIGAAGLLLAAPWLARQVTRVDETLARALLGPGRREELALRLESLTRSRADAVAAADAERRRIERDLHDGAQQRLVSLAMNLGMARSRFTCAPEPVRQAIADAHDEAVLALSELREFIRGLGYLLKDRVAHVDDFLDAVRRVAAGGTALDPEVVAQLLVRRRDDPLDRLTPRELQVLRLMAEGHSNNGIVAVLKVSPSAVEKYVTNIFAKLDLPPTGTSHRRVLAVLKYLGT